MWRWFLRNRYRNVCNRLYRWSCILMFCLSMTALYFIYWSILFQLLFEHFSSEKLDTTNRVTTAVYLMFHLFQRCSYKVECFVLYLYVVVQHIQHVQTSLIFIFFFLIHYHNLRQRKTKTQLVWNFQIKEKLSFICTIKVDYITKSICRKGWNNDAYKPSQCSLCQWILRLVSCIRLLCERFLYLKCITANSICRYGCKYDE